MENEFILQDRVQKIRQIITQYGEENFYIAFSGGKDSTVLSALIDMALPDNKIPRVYADTGIELNMIRDFVYNMQKIDNRIVVIKPSNNIRTILQKYGYPFKSKLHSVYVKKYQSKGFNYKSVRAYIQMENTLSGKRIFNPCPQKLLYQFSESNTLKISDNCCLYLKEKPLQEFSKTNNKPYGINGIIKDEGGRRERSTCILYDHRGNIKLFQPLVPITKKWEEWFINEYNIKICDIYKPPYNFNRTGCKGCPFALHLQNELDVLEKFFPAERKQCEIIWKPVYDEYRRINYRLRGDNINE